MYFIEITLTYADRLTTTDVNQDYFSTWPNNIKDHKNAYSIIGI